MTCIKCLWQNCVQLLYNRGKKTVMSAVEHDSRNVYNVLHGGKICFKCQNKTDFSRQCKNKLLVSQSHYMLVQDSRYLPVIRQFTVFLNYMHVNWSQKEINTGYLSSLINEKQFNEQANVVFSKKRLIQKLRNYSEEIIIPRVWLVWMAI